MNCKKNIYILYIYKVYKKSNEKFRKATFAAAAAAAINLQTCSFLKMQRTWKKAAALSLTGGRLGFKDRNY